MTVSRRFLAKLAAARDALSHSHPGATEEEPPPSNPDSDHVPAHVKREVWTRDGRPHNGLAARRVFGDAWMDGFGAAARGGAPSPAAGG